jgi:hypothetical protein
MGDPNNQKPVSSSLSGVWSRAYNLMLKEDAPITDTETVDSFSLYASHQSYIAVTLGHQPLQGMSYPLLDGGRQGADILQSLARPGDGDMLGHRRLTALWPRRV